MEEEMMVSPAFIKKTAGVRGEEDEETGGFTSSSSFSFSTSCSRKPYIFIFQQCCVQWVRRKGSRVQHVKLLPSLSLRDNLYVTLWSVLEERFQGIACEYITVSQGNYIIICNPLGCWLMGFGTQFCHPNMWKKIEDMAISRSWPCLRCLIPRHTCSKLSKCYPYMQKCPEYPPSGPAPGQTCNLSEFQDKSAELIIDMKI